MDQRGKDLRKGRYSEIGRIYLLTAVTYERQPIFADWRMGRLVVNEFALTQKDSLAESLAWGGHARPFSLVGYAPERLPLDPYAGCKRTKRHRN
jgi:hypothetical protein